MTISELPRGLPASLPTHNPGLIRKTGSCGSKGSVAVNSPGRTSRLAMKADSASAGAWNHRGLPCGRGGQLGQLQGVGVDRARQVASAGYLPGLGRYVQWKVGCPRRTSGGKGPSYAQENLGAPDSAKLGAHSVSAVSWGQAKQVTIIRSKLSPGDPQIRPTKGPEEGS